MRDIKDRRLIRMLTLNLHTYRELKLEDYTSFEAFFEDYSLIINKMAEVIGKEQIDIVCFQEAAQHKEMPVIAHKNGIAIRKHNMVYDIVKALNEKYGMSYDFLWDWSHYGWNVWEEGIAVISRFKIIKGDSKYLSEGSTDIHEIYSRKGVMAKLKIPGDGFLNIFSVHLNWWEKGFSNETDNLIRWAEEESKNQEITFLAGDFNNKAGEDGYNYLSAKNICGKELLDVYYNANPEGFNDATIGGDNFNDSSRIDYIWLCKSHRLKIEKSSIIFTERDYGTVSDHSGLYAEFCLEAEKE